MLTQGRNQTLSRSSWAILLAICSIIFTLLLISGTIILSLIPIYLTSKDIKIETSQNVTPLIAVYASDVINGRSLILSDTNDFSQQMMINTGGMKIQSPRFLAASASNKKKRQTSSNITYTCDQSTGLSGDLLAMDYVMQYPPGCNTPSCRQKHDSKAQDAIRMGNRRINIVIKFINETRNVQLAFCSFSSAVINNSTSINTTPSGCTSETSRYIYLLDQDSNFFRFDPTNFGVTFIGTLNCSAIAYPYSMALQRNGQAWTLFTDGSLYKFDITTAQCQTTSYLSEQEGGLILFGMNFATDGVNGIERLYFSSDSSNPPYRLATLDVDTLEISVIGYYDTISARAELTGTNDGRLFGLFEGTPYILAEINRNTAEILSKTSQNMIQYTSDSSYFAFTSYSSNFFLFVGNYNSTDIFLYDSSTNTTTKQNTISYGIVGAGGASSCINSA